MLILAIFLIVIRCTLSVTQEECKKTIYIDNQAKSAIQDGSVENPFTNLDDGLEILEEGELTDLCHIEFLVAPSPNAYTLKSQYYDYHNSTVDITLASWQNSEAKELSPTLLLSESTLRFTDFKSLRIKALKLIGTVATFMLTRTDLFIEDLEVNVTRNLVDALVDIEDAKKIEIKGLRFISSQQGYFLKYFSKIPSLMPDIVLEDITIFAKQRSRVSYLVANLTAGSVLSQRRGEVSINKVQWMLEAEDHIDIYTGNWKTSFVIKGFEDVYFGGLEIFNQNLTLRKENLVEFSRIGSLRIDGINITATKIVCLPTSIQNRPETNLLGLREIKNLTISNMDFNSNEFLGTSEQNVIFGLGQMSLVQRAQFMNHRIENNTMGDSVTVFFASGNLVAGLEIKVENINCKNNTMRASKKFSFLDVQGLCIKSLLVDGINFSMNVLPGKFFSLQGLLDSQGGIRPPVDLYFQKVNMANNLVATDTNLIYFTSAFSNGVISDCLQMIEPFRIWITECNISNNKFFKGKNTLWSYEVGLIYGTEVQINLMDSIITENYFEGYNVLRLEWKASSVLFSNNSVIDNIFNDSQLIASNYQVQDAFCSLVGNTLVSPAKLLYRYSLITDSNFSRVVLTSGALFSLKNGFVSFANNSFDVLELNKGTLVSSDFVASASSVGFEDSDQSWALRSASFGNNPIAGTKFDSVAYLAGQYDTGQLAFFNFDGNSLAKIQTRGSQLMSITGYGAKRNFIRIENNRFEEIKFFDSDSPEMIHFDDLETLVFTKNSMQFINGKPKVLSSPSESENSRSIVMDWNSVRNSTLESLFIFYGDSLKDLSFSHNDFRFSVFSQSCMSINVKRATGDFLLEGNYFSRTEFMVASSRNLVERCGFISIYTRDSIEKSHLLVFNNTFLFVFSNFISESLQTAKLHFFLIQGPQPVEFKNLTFKQGQLSSEGSLIRVSNSPSLSISDSLFSVFYFFDEDGMIMTCANTVTLRNNDFLILTNRKNSGLLSLSPFSKKLALLMENNRFSNISVRGENKNELMDLAGVIVTVKPHKAESLSEDEEAGETHIAFSMVFSDCQVENIDNGYVVKLIKTFCQECLIRNIPFAAFQREIILGMGIVEISEGSIGELHVEDITLPLWNPEPFPFFRILDSEFALKLERVKSISSTSENLFLALMNSGSLLIKDSEFKNFTVQEESVIKIVPGNGNYSLPRLTLEDVTIEAAFNIGVNSNYMALMETAFKYFYNPSIGAWTNSMIFCAAPALISIQKCKFLDLYEMPALFVADPEDVYSTSSDASSVEVVDTLFFESSFDIGNSIVVLKQYLDRLDLKVKNCTFEKGHGFAGGSMFIMGANLTVTDSHFIENHASISATVFLDEYAYRNFVSSGNFFLKNDAPHNGDVGTIAVKAKLKFVAAEGSLSKSYFNDTTKTLSIENVSVSELAHGTLVFEFFDRNDSPAPNILTAAEAFLEIPTQTASKFTLPAHWMNLYAGSSPLSNIPFNNKAGESMTITFKYNSQTIDESYTIYIQLRDCIPGEYNNGGKCEECSESTFSLSPEVPCALCLPNTKCSRRSEICPSPGFWNLNSSSREIIPCRNDSIFRCENRFDSCQSCAEGYTGPLCSSCDFENSFVEGGYLKCGKCKDPSRSLLYSGLVTVLYLFYQFFSVHLVYDGNKKILANEEDFLVRRKIERSFYTKSMLTYTQLMSILYMESSEIYRSLGLFSQVGSPSALITYGTQCTLTALGIHYNDFLYYQIAMVVGAPIMQFLMIVVLMLLLRLIFSDKAAYKKLVVATMYLILSYQPGIITNLAQMLSCSTVNGLGYDYISSHPHWECNTPIYNLFANHIAIPNLLLWSLAIPLVILTVLILNRRNLKSENLRVKIGVLFFDLKEKYYYWGIILMILKVVLSLLAYGLERKGEIPIFISLAFLWVYQSAVRTVRPYNTSSFNNFEITLMNLLMFNIIVARYLLMPSNESIIHYIALVVAVAFNGGFLLLALSKILSLTLIQALSWFERKILKRNISRRAHLLEQNRSTIMKSENSTTL